MPTYRVSWSLDIDARTPREAAEKARHHQIHRLIEAVECFKVQELGVALPITFLIDLGDNYA